MKRYLVVANRTLAADELQRRARRLLSEPDGCSFYVVVPATPNPEGWTWTEGESKLLASDRLRATIGILRRLGSRAEGEVGDARALDAIRDALSAAGPFDGIILCTIRPGISRWLRLDLPHRVSMSFDLPVAHVIDPEMPSPFRAA